MKLRIDFFRLPRPLVLAVLVFFLSLGCVVLLIWQFEQTRIQKERVRVLDISSNYAYFLQRNIEHVLSVTYALAGLVRQGGGVVSDFDGIATQMRPFYVGASSINLAPKGVVQYVAPWEGHESMLGMDLFKDPKQSKEALLARDAGKLTLAGPFSLPDGEQGMVGMLPVHLNGHAGKPVFWGLVNVEMRLSSVLKTTKLADLERRGYVYELWRIDPNTGLKQVISVSSRPVLERPVSRKIDVPNAAWTLSVVPVEGWFDYSDAIEKLMLGLVLSLVLAFLAKLYADRRVAEVARLDLLGRFQSIDAHVPGVIYQFRLDADGQCSFPYANDFIRTVYRVTPEQIREDVSAITKVIHPDDYPELKASILQSAQNLSPLQHEYRVNFDDGTVRWLHNNASPKRDSDGSVLWHGFITDVTERKLTEIALQDSERRFRVLVQRLPLPLGYVDTNSAVIYLNDRFIETFGYTLEDIPHVEDWWRLAIPDPDYQRWARQAWAEAVERAALSRQDVEPLEYRVRCKDGTVRDVLVSGIAIGGNWLSTFVDITERKRADAKQRLAASVFACSSEGIIICDATNTIIDLNPAFTRITGYAREEVIGANPNILNSGRHESAFYTKMWQTIQQAGSWHGEVWNRHKSGLVYPELLTISGVRDNVGAITHYIGIFSDITLLKAHEAELERNANFDLLTGLPNRRLLMDRINQAIARTNRSGKFMALCYLDLDGFKAINDRLGHDAGDCLLVELSRRFEVCMRVGDSVARLGGDEFAIVLQDLEYPEDYDVALRRILEAASAPVVLGDQEVAVSASIGVTLVPQDGSEADVLLRHADQAMYQAKQFGRGRYHVFSSPIGTHWPSNLNTLVGPLRPDL